MEQELDLYAIWRIFVKRWRIIVLVPILAVVVTALVCIIFITPQYSASTSLIVMKRTDYSQIVVQDIQVSRQLVMTYREIAQSPRVLEKVIQKANLPYNYSTLREKVEVTPVRDTEVFEISATDPSPRMAALIANQVAAVFMEEVLDIMKVENVSVLHAASEPEKPVSPRISLSLAVALVVGLMAAVGLAFLLEHLDNTIKTPEEVQNYLELPVLGVIPYIEER